MTLHAHARAAHVGMYLGTVWDEHRGGVHIALGNEDRKRNKEVQPIMRFTPRTQAERIEQDVSLPLPSPCPGV